MNENISKYVTTTKEYWSSRSKKQKGFFIGGAIAIVLAIIVTGIFANRTVMAPLYTNLTPAETGSITEILTGQAVPYELGANGTSILVPEEQADALKVQLAAQGLPNSGEITFATIGQGSGFGQTENEFNASKLAAMQTELANLIKGIEGINDAKVMISLPEQGVFVNTTTDQASASVLLNTQPGFQLSDQQVETLYHLVSKSIPNLSTDNIVISNQNFEYFDLNKSNSGVATISDQMGIKKQIEQDIQRQVQSMLTMLMGNGKAMATVTADIDFSKKNSVEDLVEPVDEENMRGIEISAQNITETYTGAGANIGGVPQGEDPADALGAGYVEGANGNGDYERTESTINSEVNRIRNEIAGADYKIRDLGIQVLLEPPNPDDETSMPAGLEQNVEQILSTIIRTSIDKDVGTPLTDEEIDSKVSVNVHKLNGKTEFVANSTPTIPWYVYVVGGILLAVIILLLFFILRSRKSKVEEEDDSLLEVASTINVADVNQEKVTEGTLKRKQLEKMAKEKPDEFAKLLRTWIAED